MEVSAKIIPFPDRSNPLRNFFSRVRDQSPESGTRKTLRASVKEFPQVRERNLLMDWAREQG